MKIQPYRLRLLLPPQDDLLEAVRRAVKNIPEHSVVVVSAKVVSIWQGRCISKLGLGKNDLIRREADRYLDRSLTPHRYAMHTITHGLFVPSAGIDSSNGDGFYILWPSRPHAAAKKFQTWLKKTYRRKNLGVIIADSHSVPLRRGTVGIALGHAGFLPLRDYRKTRDLFGRKLKSTQSNIADALATAAVVVMGEGAERTPLAIIQNVPGITFTKAKSRKKFSSLEVPPREDMYAALFRKLPWKRGEGGHRLEKK